MQTIPIEVNGDGVHSIAVPDRITVEGSFEIAIDNQGQAAHVHLNVDDDLGRIASLVETNHYLEADARRVVHVDVNPNRPDGTVRGKLKAVVGHGSGTAYLTVIVEPAPDPESESVTVDESLSDPPERDPEPTPAERFVAALDAVFGDGLGPAIVVAAIAVGLALAVGTALNTPTVFLAAGIVVAAVVVALALALR
ncbi:hypothetical protein SAMN05192561_101694 [Halopenitus malekzadehii]|uniref:Uncharacterized protein n=1 Tax=Halopenitus malekzadehii TaxID=1267564 RepID=A0A1H6I3D1_9EURY|nr:hypothetical protein [Halopenitus malekzadehii]SEH40800.1 hypothetical protein SAMN05192561_101694 [Halopenitus malekzadehii]